MQLFDLSHHVSLNNILTPTYTLQELGHQKWFLSKVRVDYDCEIDMEYLEGQITLKSNKNVQIELDWLIQDSNEELQILFKGIETPANSGTSILIKGAMLADEKQHQLSTQALILWLDGTLIPMLPHLRKDIKSRLNLWDYAHYND